MSAASKRTVRNARKRAETKQHGRELTPNERVQKTQAQLVQAQSVAHVRAKEYLELVHGIRTTMVALAADLPNDRKAKAQRKQLLKELEAFNDRICGARAYVIETGMALIDGVPLNPAEPPPEPPRVRTATMAEAEARAKEHGAK